MKRHLFTIATSLLVATPALCDTLYVDANLTSGANDGTSWTNAYQGSNGLQLALAASASGDQIFAADGTYQPTAATSRTISFALKNGVEIYGGFAGGEANLFVRPPIGMFESILDGDLLGNDPQNQFNDNSYHLVTTFGTNATAVLDGFRVQNGNANGSGNNDTGGGILLISNVRPTIRNCHFIDNRCTFGGGAGYINGSGPKFYDCTFEDNIGGSFGGAFDIATANSVLFDRCTFIGNRANRAGALEVFASSNIQVFNCLFLDNLVTGSSGGGGLWFGSGGSSQVRNCTIVGNRASAQAGGAGLRNQGAVVSVINCIIRDNEGPGGTQTLANQISGASATYSNVEGITSGTGNIDMDPMFAAAGSGDYSVLATSPVIDAGSNAGVPAVSTLDIQHARRMVDIPSVPDTGQGTAPIVDMGAYEFAAGPGRFYCSTDPNTSGFPGRIFASGSNSIQANNLALFADNLPTNEFAIFICGTERGFVAGPGGSFGNLCVGGSLGRFNAPSQILTTGPLGIITLPIDLTDMPQPNGSVVVIAGESWHFQAWFRDNILGQSISNFTDGMTIDFE